MKELLNLEKNRLNLIAEEKLMKILDNISPFISVFAVRLADLAVRVSSFSNIEMKRKTKSDRKKRKVLTSSIIFVLVSFLFVTAVVLGVVFIEKVIFSNEQTLKSEFKDMIRNNIQLLNTSFNLTWHARLRSEGHIIDESTFFKIINVNDPLELRKTRNVFRDGIANLDPESFCEDSFVSSNVLFAKPCLELSQAHSIQISTVNLTRYDLYSYAIENWNRVAEFIISESENWNYQATKTLEHVHSLLLGFNLYNIKASQTFISSDKEKRILSMCWFYIFSSLFFIVTGVCLGLVTKSMIVRQRIRFEKVAWFFTVLPKVRY